MSELSSAHVYLRMKKGEKLKELPEDVIRECAYLTKANSIEGSKRTTVDIVYTKWMNLKKTNSMEAGQVGFKDDARVFHLRKVEKCNAVVNDLNRTKDEQYPDLEAIQEKRMGEIREQRKQDRQRLEAAQQEAKRKSEEQKKLRSYDSLFKEADLNAGAIAQEYGSSIDQSSATAYEDDFM